MGIPLGGGNFTRGAAIPLDDSFVAADLTARDAIIAGIRYEGMLVYVVADGAMYQLQGGITNGDWAAAGGGGGGSVPIVDLATGDGVLTAFTLSVDPGTEENVAVYLDGVRQSTAEYSVVTTTLTFSVAPYNGATLMFVSGGVTAVNVPADGSVTTVKIATNAVTHDKMAARATGTTVAAGGVAISASSGSYSNATTTYTDVTNLSVTISTTGRPVFVGLMSSGTASSSTVGGSTTSASNNPGIILKFVRGATDISIQEINTVSDSTDGYIVTPPSSFHHVDVVAAGTYTYKVQAKTTSAVNTNSTVVDTKLVVYEL
jgi:hypothetical protein